MRGPALAHSARPPCPPPPAHRVHPRPPTVSTPAHRRGPPARGRGVRGTMEPMDGERDTSDERDASTDGTTFEDLGLRPELLRALSSLGYEEPTPIQQKAIPPLVEGRDLLGQ